MTRPDKIQLTNVWPDQTAEGLPLTTTCWGEFEDHSILRERERESQSTLSVTAGKNTVEQRLKAVIAVSDWGGVTNSSKGGGSYSLQMSAKLAKDVFLVPTLNTWGGLMTKRFLSPAIISGFFSRMMSNTRDSSCDNTSKLVSDAWTVSDSDEEQSHVHYRIQTWLTQIMVKKLENVFLLIIIMLNTHTNLPTNTNDLDSYQSFIRVHILIIHWTSFFLSPLTYFLCIITLVDLPFFFFNKGMHSVLVLRGTSSNKTETGLKEAL